MNAHRHAFAAVDFALDHGDVFFAVAAVDQLDTHAVVKEAQLADTLGEDVVVVFDGAEDFLVGQILHAGAALVGVAQELERAGFDAVDDFDDAVDGVAAVELHGVFFAVARDGELEPLGERVDARDAHAVQAAGNLVAVLVELAAGVEHAHDDLGRGAFGLVLVVHLDADRDAAAVVGDLHPPVVEQSDGDPVGEPGHRLVHRVVHDFPDQVVQTALTGADGAVYAVAQGPVAAPLPRPAENNNLQLYNFSVYNRRIPPNDRLNQERHNSAHIPGGAIIEKGVSQPTVMVDDAKKTKTSKLSLHYFDLMTARNVVAAINKKFPNTAAFGNDGTIALNIPYTADHIDYLTKILEVKVDVPERTKVVLDTRTGTIVSGGSVAISAVMVTHNGMQIEVSNKKAYTYGEEKSPANAELKEGATVKELVDNLNKLGLTSAEIIDVIKAIHSAGALHGELTVM